MPPIIDSYSSSNWVDGIYAVGGDTIAIGQSFTGDGQYVQRVVFLLQRVGSPNYNLTARIYAHTGTFGSTGTPTGSILAESTAVNGLTLTGSTRLVSFEFDGTFLAEDGVNYFVVFHGGEGDGSNFFYVGADNTSSAHAGNIAYYTTSNGYWTSSANDLIFYVFGPSPKLVTKTPLPNLGGAYVSSFDFDAFNAVAGNLIFVYIRPSPQSTPFTSLTVSDTAGNEYTRIGDILYSVDGGSHAMFYAKNINGDASNVVTVSSVPDTRYSLGSVLQFSGLDAADPLDSFGALTDHGYLNPGDPNLSGTFSTSNANDLIVAAMFGLSVNLYSYDFVESTRVADEHSTAYAVVDQTKSNINVGALSQGTGWASAGAAAFKLASGYVSKRRSLFRGRSFPFFDDEEVNRFEFWKVGGAGPQQRTISVTVTATPTLAQQVNLVQAVTSAITIALGRAVTRALDLVTAVGTASVISEVQRLLGPVTSTGTPTIQKARAATVTVNSAATATVARAAARGMAVTGTGTPTIKRDIGRGLAVVSTATVVIGWAVSRGFAVVSTVVATLISSKAFLRNVLATATGTATLTAKSGPTVAVTATQAVTLVRQVARAITATGNVTATIQRAAQRILLAPATVTVTVTPGSRALVALTANVLAQIERWVLRNVIVTATGQPIVLAQKTLVREVAEATTVSLLRLAQRGLATVATGTATVRQEAARTVAAQSTVTATARKDVARTMVATSNATAQAYPTDTHEIAVEARATVTLGRRVLRTMAVTVTGAVTYLTRVFRGLRGQLRGAAARDARTRAQAAGRAQTMARAVRDSRTRAKPREEE